MPAQKVDSIYVHLYTDSLKAGTYNYINIDGRLPNGRFIPLDTTQVIFLSDYGKFLGNSLWLDKDFSKDKVRIRVILKQNPDICKEFNIYIKKAPDPDLPTEKELLEKMKRGRRSVSMTKWNDFRDGYALSSV